MSIFTRTGLGLLLSFVLMNGVAAQEHQSVNDANNPLTPKITVNFHNYYVPEIYGLSGRRSNQFLLRGLVPAEIVGLPQLLRYTLPIATAPEFPDGYVTGLGDLTLMDIFILPKHGDITFGAGPILVIPTATDDALGSGKWQVGASGVIVAPQSWGLLGGLVTYQTSFAGLGDRERVSLATVEPIINYNLKDGWYLRSTATWNFNLEDNEGYIPVGLGIGKVFELDKGITMNAFIEPQYTVWHQGDGAPKWQIFAGVNFQFPVKK
ncbi:Possible Neuromedin U precursor [Ochrobactrum soli]|uniref:Possible Neuromedin U n=2 Tax=Ochrobactrum soli TaxID=2448455 RepID=A0A2P9HCB3_9HYPH|nr:Possible Neuromedin U precursor [[Ochrobactrum] soli]